MADRPTSYFGFIDKANFDAARIMMHSLAITYEVSQIGWGYKFKVRLKPETYKDILAHLKPEDTTFKFWPIASSQLRNKIQTTSRIQPYFDFVTLSEINKNVLEQYTQQNRIPTFTQAGFPCFQLIEVDPKMMNVEYVRLACEGIAQSPRGNYKQALANAANRMSGVVQQSNDNNDEDDDENQQNQIKRTSEEDNAIVMLYKALEVQLDLSKERLPPPVIGVPGMNMKSMAPQQTGLRSTARQIIDPAGIFRRG